MAIKQYQAAGGVVIQQGKIDGLDGERAYVLLLDRPDLDEVRLPKGHIDPGEDALTTALRETAEETGYTDLEILADLGSATVEFDYRGDHYIRDEHYFLMKLRSPAQIQRPVHDAHQFHPLWIEMEEAARLLTFEAEQQVIDRAIRHYSQP
ncbi:MAG: NUDIX domain-containing protein [Chloroflexi bacterium]|nr:NUDIX domain-containing protein [Chloroflexota bacterium]